MQILKKAAAFIICLMLVLSLFTGIAMADEDTISEQPVVEEEQKDNTDSLNIEEYVEVEEEADADPIKSVDNDELLEEYIEVQLFTSNKPMYSVNGAGKRLTGTDRMAYDFLKAKAAQVASGEIADAQFTLMAADMGLQSSYTAADLGLDSLGTTSLTDEAITAVNNLFPNLSSIVTALLYDCPYDFYWYDKATQGACRMSYGYSISSSGGNITAIVNPSATFRFTVAEEYADPDGNYFYSNGVLHLITVDDSKTTAVNTAVENIHSIVESNADLSDYQKISAYKDTINDMVDYNHEAADDNNNTPYGNPWQLIWVFDDDDSTKVVCEGYSKAFQYLCDLSDFKNSKVESRIVTGTMSGGTGAGGHMWNVVTMNDEKNYLVDVTNCDSGSIGYPDKLFLVGNENGNVNTGYIFSISSNPISFIYDSDTLSTYDSSELSLNTTSYDPNYEEPHTHDFVFDTMNWDEGYENANAVFHCSVCGMNTTVDDVVVTHEVREADCELPTRTTHIATLSAEKSLDGIEHSDSKEVPILVPGEMEATVYRRISSNNNFELGKEYLLVNRISAGEGHALSTGSGLSVSDLPVTIQTGEIIIDGTPANETYIEIDNDAAVWTLEYWGDYYGASAYLFKNVNNGYYLGKRTQNRVGYLNCNTSKSPWFFTSNQISWSVVVGTMTPSYSIFNIDFIDGAWALTYVSDKDGDRLPEPAWGHNCFLYEKATITRTVDQEIPALGHDFVDWTITSNATCTEPGEEIRVCSRCGKTETRQIPATGHTAETIPAVEATCTSAGLTEGKKCMVCGEILVAQESIPTLAHDLVHHEAQAATCTGTGWEAYDTCSRCDYTTYVEIPATGHTEETLPAAAATCTETGLTEGRKCSVCGEILTAQEVIPALGHDLVHHEAQAATCTGTGWEAYDTCSRCDFTTYEAIPSKGHSWEFKGIIFNEAEAGGYAATANYVCKNDAEHKQNVAAEVTVSETDASCTGAGTTTYTATVKAETSLDGEEHTDSKTVTGEALGHEWGEWKVTTSPTCTVSGEETRTCSRCGHTETREVEAPGHKEENLPAAAATCTETGLTEGRKCSVCGEILTAQEVIPALGHDLVHHEAQAATCTGTGWEAYDTCSRCDFTTYEAIPAKGHSWEFKGIIFTEAEAGGYAATANYVCRNDAEHKQNVAAEVTVSETDASCTEAGTTTYTATVKAETSVDREEHTNSKTITGEALGHAWDYENIKWSWTPTEEGGYTAAATLTCNNDASHTETVEADVTGPVDNVYTAAFTGPDGKTYSDTFNPTPDYYDERISGTDRYATATEAAKRYKDITGTPFKNVVVACGTNFPDALAGGYLADQKDAPILLVTDWNEGEIAAFIKKNMDPDGTVYLLGGTGVVSSSFENKIKGESLNVKRLGGADRYETNIKILKEAGVTDEEILVCTGTGYADSLSASAVGLPILLVGDSINGQQRDYLKSIESNKFYLIGGPGAVKESVWTSLQNINADYLINRIYGQTRYETSTAVADYFFPQTENVLLAYAQNFPDGLSGGPLAMKIKAPILLVDSNNTGAASAYVKRSGASGSITLGGPTLISDAAINRILDK